MSSIGLFDISGSVMTVASSTDQNTSGSVNIKRKEERGLYSRLLMGTALKTEVGEARTSGDSNLFATRPSWTGRQTGRHHEFVSMPLSSSDHEVYNMNAWVSGSASLENSAVSATGTLFYSKQNRFVRSVYAVTASAQLVVLNTASFSASTWDFGSGRSTFVAASGTFVPRGGGDITIDVPDYGKIVDLKVWVELITDPRSFPPSPGGVPGIGELSLAIENPNVQGFAGAPVMNIKQVSSYFTGGKALFPVNWNIDNSYILWASDNSLWFRDLDIRTVFSDGSPQPHALHLDPLFAAGGSHGDYTLLSGSTPNFQLVNRFGSINSFTASYDGNFVPWFADFRVKGWNLSSASYANYLTLVSGSPPPGWLTGPGGGANVNEFSTTGSNLGPSSMRPLYPLLDDVYVGIDDPGGAIDPSSQPLYDVVSRRLLGFRPGLRGKEIHGKWTLHVVTRNYGVWFRQIRLDITYDKNVGAEYSTNHTRRLLYRKSGRGSEGREVRCLLSSSFLSGIEKTYVIAQTQYGRTVGITDQTGSFAEFAVFSRLTGSIADRLSGSQASFYLRNEFGTPFIPISSGTSVPVGFDLDSSYIEQQAAARKMIFDVISPKPMINPSNTLRSSLSRSGKIASTRSIVEDIFSSGSG